MNNNILIKIANHLSFEDIAKVDKLKLLKGSEIVDKIANDYLYIIHPPFFRYKYDFYLFSAISLENVKKHICELPEIKIRKIIKCITNESYYCFTINSDLHFIKEYTLITFGKICKISDNKLSIKIYDTIYDVDISNFYIINRPCIKLTYLSLYKKLKNISVPKIIYMNLLDKELIIGYNIDIVPLENIYL